MVLLCQRMVKGNGPAPALCSLDRDRQIDTPARAAPLNRFLKRLLERCREPFDEIKPL